MELGGTDYAVRDNAGVAFLAIQAFGTPSWEGEEREGGERSHIICWPERLSKLRMAYSL